MGIAERKAREFKRREEEILAAAIALFHERDIEAVTVAEISERAEIGKGTVYKHFRSKDEIVARILLDIRRKLYWELKRELVPGLGPVEILRKSIEVGWRLHLEDPLFHLRMHSYYEKENFIARISPGLAEDLATAEDSLLSLYRELIRKGIKQGLFKKGDVNLMLFAASAAINGAIRMALTASSSYRSLFQQEPFQQYLIDFILKGLGWKQAKRGGKSRAP